MRTMRPGAPPEQGTSGTHAVTGKRRRTARTHPHAGRRETGSTGIEEFAAGAAAPYGAGGAGAAAGAGCGAEALAGKLGA